MYKCFLTHWSKRLPKLKITLQVLGRCQHWPQQDYLENDHGHNTAQELCCGAIEFALIAFGMDVVIAQHGQSQSYMSHMVLWIVQENHYK
jgi:hypothetical protein